MDAQPLLTPVDVGDRLNLKTARVIRLSREGKLPAIALPGGEFRFDAADLEKWLASQRVQPREAMQ